MKLEMYPNKEYVLRNRVERNLQNRKNIDIYTHTHTHTHTHAHTHTHTNLTSRLARKNILWNHALNIVSDGTRIPSFGKGIFRIHGTNLLNTCGVVIK